MMVRQTSAVVLADLAERLRRPSFLVVVVLTAVLAALALPPAGAPYLMLSLGGHRQPDFTFVGAYRGVYNSAWVGLQTASVVGAWVTLFGFFLARGGVARDARLGVGEMVASTPLRNLTYVLGKFLSAFLLFAVLLAWMVVAATAVQLARGEDLQLRPWPLAGPLFLLGLPALAMMAAVATLFDCVLWLRGLAGSLLYFVLWTFSLSGVLAGPLDWLGLGVVATAMSQAGTAYHIPGFNGGLGLGGTMDVAGVHTFRWDGLQWSSGMIVGRLAWLPVALVLAAGGSLFFDRFEPVHARSARPWLRFVPQSRPEVTVDAGAPRAVRLTPLSARTSSRVGGLLLAEMLLLARSLSWWWYVAAIGLVVSVAAVPFAIAQTYLYPLAWLWLIVPWSQMGSQQVRHGTEDVMFSAPHPVARQLLLEWGAGVVVGAVLVSSMAVRLAAAGDESSVLGLAAGLLAVVALALAAGVWIGNGRLFEVLYLLAWYVGVLQHLPILDYAATTPAASVARLPIVAVLVAVLLLAVAGLGRLRPR